MKWKLNFNAAAAKKSFTDAWTALQKNPNVVGAKKSFTDAWNALKTDPKQTFKNGLMRIGVDLPVQTTVTSPKSWFSNKALARELMTGGPKMSKQAINDYIRRYRTTQALGAAAFASMLGAAGIANGIAYKAGKNSAAAQRE